MTEEGLTSLGGGTDINWANEEDSDDGPWNQNFNNEAKPLSMRELMEQQEKELKEKQAKEEKYVPKRQEVYTESSYSTFQGGRRKNEIPTQGPFTAYLGLSFSVNEDDILHFFDDLDPIHETVKIMFDRDSGRSKGFGYITFNSRQGLEQALERNGENFHGRALKVDIADPPKSQQSFGGYGQRNNSRYGSNQGGYGGNQGRERKGLNLQPRTAPLDERHLNPGTPDGHGVVLPIKEQPVRTQQPQEKPKKSNPFGNATAVDLGNKYLEKGLKPVERQAKEETKRTEPLNRYQSPRDDRNTEWGSNRNETQNRRGENNKRVGRVNNNGKQRKTYNNKKPQQRDSDGFSLRGGKKGGRKMISTQDEVNEEDTTNVQNTSSNPFDILMNQ